MKPYIPILIVLMLISASFVGVSYNLEQTSTVSSDGKTLYVGGIGLGNYTKIQDAVNDASDGDTVFVYNGTYYEHRIYINNSITLKGEDKNTTILDGEGFGRIITLKTDSIILRGFTFINSEKVTDDTSVISIGYDYNEIFDNILLYNKIDGIIVWDDHHHNVIRDNYIKNSRYGIFFRYGCYNNTVSGNNITNCKYGILFNSGSVNVFENVLLENDYAMLFLYSSNNIVSRNICKNNEYGIYIGHTCKNNSVSKNYVKGNKIYGVLIFEGENHVISGNNITENLVGISVRFSPKNAITCNNLIKNKRNAIFRGLRKNKWDGNYWGSPRTNPKPIIGFLGLFGLIPWLNFDKNPAQEPYDIGGDL